MNAIFCAVCASLMGQAPAPSQPAPTPTAALFQDVGAPASGTYEPPPPSTVTPFSAATGSFDDLGVTPAQYAQPMVAPPLAAGVAPAAAPVVGAPNYAQAFEEARGLFQSDHAFDGFTGPLSNPVQFKDPRSLTELRFLFMADFSKPNTPVLGRGTAQVYALQVRIALSERLQFYADKDGIVRLSPNPGRSITGLANLMAGLKYVWIRDVENQFLFSTALQYEAPTGYGNIYQNQGSGLIGLYGILGKEFGNWHMIFQFGENIAVQNQQSGYFMTSFHLDRRFGRFTPFYEANWFYYNQPGKFLPLSMEGGGWVNLGSSHVNGLNYVTNAVGFKYDLTKSLELGVGYEFQLTTRTMLLYNMLHAQLIWRY